MMKKFCILIVLILAVNMLMGCNIFTSKKEKEDNKFKISGTITSGRGGGVEKNVIVLADNQKATTNQHGQFQFLVEKGEYNIVAKKDGFGVSKYQDVKVNSNSVPSDLEMIMLSDSGIDDTSPPGITVKGIDPNEQISGVQSYTVKIDSDISVNRVKIYQGKEGLKANISQKFTTVIKERWQTTNYPNGQSCLTVEVEDANHNISKKKIPVTIKNSDSNEGKISAPQALVVTSMTWGREKDNFFNIKSNLKKRAPKINWKSVQKTITEKKQTDFGAKRTTMYNIVSLPPSKNQGYLIYRSYSRGRNYQQIAQINPKMVKSHQNYTYVDMDAQLAAGKPVYYKVKAYNQSEVSQAVGPVMVAPLPKVNVKLKTPADNDSSVSRSPNFKWEISRLPKSYQIEGRNYQEKFSFQFQVQEADGEYFCKKQLKQHREKFDFSRQNMELELATEYQWNINSGGGRIIYNGRKNGDRFLSKAISVYGSRSGSLNGGFRFVTKSEQ